MKPDALHTQGVSSFSPHTQRKNNGKASQKKKKKKICGVLSLLLFFFLDGGVSECRFFFFFGICFGGKQTDGVSFLLPADPFFLVGSSRWGRF
jgi:hypothetical protein